MMRTKTMIATGGTREATKRVERVLEMTTMTKMKIEGRRNQIRTRRKHPQAVVWILNIFCNNSE